MKSLLSNYMPSGRPSLRVCFVGFAYLLSALGVACLMLGEVMPLAVGMLFLTALGICFILEMMYKIPRIPPIRFSIWGWGLVVLPLIYLVWRPPLLDLTIGFLVFILLTRFIFKSELNDYLYGYLISIICLLVGAIFIQDMVFAALFLSFYLILSWCLMFYNIMVERVGTHCPPSGFMHVGEQEAAGGSFFTLSATMILASFLLTAVIFISFPRMGLGIISLDSGTDTVSGFSNRVELGDVGRIKQNDSVVMRVVFRKNGQVYHPPSKILWRGVALDFYDNQTWTNSMSPVWQKFNVQERGVAMPPVPHLRETVVQEIYRESFNSPVVFTYGIPLHIEGAFRIIQMDQGYSFKILDHHNEPRRFIVTAGLGEPETYYPEPDGFNKGPFYFNRFLQLPETTPRTIQLARGLVDSADGPRVKADKILKYLKQNFGYTLNMERNGTGPVLDEFLFVRKEGHCEYFASAMAVMLRINGIPSRVINGFAGTEWNDLGQYMIVRQAHAHSWVEAYIPGLGWRTYDPTPPDPAGVHSRSALDRRLDLMRLYWQRYVVRYSKQDQSHMVDFFNRETQKLKSQWKAWQAPDLKDLLALLENPLWVLILLGSALLGGRFLFQQYRQRAAGWKPHQPFAVQMYQQMLKRLESHGIFKPKTATHLEFLGALKNLPPEKFDAVKSVTRFYEKNRFGKLTFSSSDQNEIRSLIRKI